MRKSFFNVFTLVLFLGLNLGASYAGDMSNKVEWKPTKEVDIPEKKHIFYMDVLPNLIAVGDKTAELVWEKHPNKTKSYETRDACDFYFELKREHIQQDIKARKSLKEQLSCAQKEKGILAGKLKSQQEEILKKHEVFNKKNEILEKQLQDIQNDKEKIIALLKQEQDSVVKENETLKAQLEISRSLMKDLFGEMLNDLLVLSCNQLGKNKVVSGQWFSQRAYTYSGEVFTPGNEKPFTDDTVKQEKVSGEFKKTEEVEVVKSAKASENLQSKESDKGAEKIDLLKNDLVLIRQIHRNSLNADPDEKWSDDSWDEYEKNLTDKEWGKVIQYIEDDFPNAKGGEVIANNKALDIEQVRQTYRKCFNIDSDMRWSNQDWDKYESSMTEQDWDKFASYIGENFS